MYTGLRPWAESAVSAAAGRPSAVPFAFEAYEQARAAGSPISAVAYLAAAARYGAVKQAAEALDEWGYHFDAPVSAARAIGIRARADGGGKALAAAAEHHVTVGLLTDGLGLAELAVAAFGRERSDASTRSAELVAGLRRRLRQRDTAPAHLVPLTRRELEIATLAAKGMSDRDIAAVLVVSVRTVESHLAAVYRKLEITSRRALRAALDPSP